MQKLVKRPSSGSATERELVAAQRALIALAQHVPTVQAAADTRIHQSQVSRLFRGQFKRVSGNVRRLLAYAGAEPGKGAAPKARGGQAKEAVIRAALRAWDTTPEGARSLVRLLKSVEEIRARGRVRR